MLPLGSLAGDFEDDEGKKKGAAAKGEEKSQYEFLPSPESILEEVVPTSFKVKLFKCFLDAAVSEQIARMVAMKSATENAGELIKQLEHAIQPCPPGPHYERADGPHWRRRSP